MLKGEDIIVLLKLVGLPPSWTVRTLADETTIPRTVVHRALKRLETARLFDERHRRVNISQSVEFLIHGVRYVFPAMLEGESRGIPTAWAAEPLLSHILSSPDELPPVWPDAFGERRGLTVRPLHPSANQAARRDSGLGERLALVDGLRLGDARIRSMAAELLTQRLDRVPA